MSWTTIPDSQKISCPRCTYDNQHKAPVCDACGYNFQQKDTGTCQSCFQPINGTYIEISGGSQYHPQCLICVGCQREIGANDVVRKDGGFYHSTCAHELFHPRCTVCNEFLPDQYLVNDQNQSYCPKHEGTMIACWSCSKIKRTVDEDYAELPDGRRLCDGCISRSPVLCDDDTFVGNVLQFLHNQGLSISQRISVHVVAKHVMEDQLGASDTRHREHLGLCLSEETEIEHYSPFGASWVEAKSRVSGIIIISGMPYERAGGVLAHEMMHAFLRLSHIKNLDPIVEEGICDVIQYLWITRPGTVDDWYRKHLINGMERNPDTTYGGGFRNGMTAFLKFGLAAVVEHIRHTGQFPE